MGWDCEMCLDERVILVACPNGEEADSGHIRCVCGECGDGLIEIPCPECRSDEQQKGK